VVFAWACGAVKRTESPIQISVYNTHVVLLCGNGGIEGHYVAGPVLVDSSTEMI
jgi:hypothetical protein